MSLGYLYIFVRWTASKVKVCLPQDSMPSFFGGCPPKLSSIVLWILQDECKDKNKPSSMSQKCFFFCASKEPVLGQECVFSNRRDSLL